jgi:hypothetical protein
MRRAAAAVLTLLTLGLAFSTALFHAKYRDAERHAAAVERREDLLHARYASALSAIATIQDSLNALAMGEEALALEESGARSERQLASGSDPVLDRIAELRGNVDRARSRIGDLDANLQRSGLRLRSLELGISRIQLASASKDERIVVLRRQVDSLQSTVTGLLADSEELRRELGTVLVAVGTRKELTRAGIVVQEGGILGLGRTLKPSGNLDEAALVPIDTDMQKTLVLRAGHAEVVSAQPLSSYRIESMGEQVRIHILDPHEFRKVKHLVIVTT